MRAVCEDRFYRIPLFPKRKPVEANRFRKTYSI